MPERTTTSPARKKLVLALFGAAALAGVAFFAFRLRGSGFDWSRFVAAFVTVDLTRLAAAFVLLYVSYLGRALRWRVMTRPVAPRAKLANLLSSTFVGFTAVTLFGRPGELVRPYLIAAKEKVPFSSQIAIWLLERIYDLLIVLLLFGFALTQADSHTAPPGSWLEWILRTGGYFVAGLSAVCVAILVMVGTFGDVSKRRIQEGLGALPAKYRSRLESVLLSFVRGMQSTRQRSFVFQLLAYTILEWFVIAACNYCLFLSFPPTSHFTWVDNLIFVGFVSFGSVVQVPGIGGGFQVAAVLMLTEFFGVSIEASTAITLLIWLTMYVAVVPVGLLLAISQGLKWRNLKHISESEAEDLQLQEQSARTTLPGKEDQ